MFGTTQDTEEENLIILWDDTEVSQTQTIESPVSESNDNTISEFSLDLWDTVEQKVETPSFEASSSFSMDWFDLSASNEEDKKEDVKNESQDLSLDFFNSGTSEVAPVNEITPSSDSFSFGETTPIASDEVVSDADDMITILSGTIAKLKGRQSVIGGTKLKKMSEVDELNQKINDLKEEVSTLKDEISSLESENSQIEKNVQALESMKGIPSTSAKVHTIKRAPNTKKV